MITRHHAPKRARRASLLAVAAVGLLSLAPSLWAEPDTAVAPTEIQPVVKLEKETVHLTWPKNAKIFMMLPGGEQLLVSSKGRAPAGNIYAINTKDGSVAWTRSLNKLALYSHALSPDGKVLFAHIGLHGHFISTADGTDLGKADLKIDFSARSQIAAWSKDGKFVDIFLPTKTQRIDAVRFKSGPVVELVSPGVDGKFRGKSYVLPGTNTFMLTGSGTGSVYSFEGGGTEFKKVMQLPADKAGSPSTVTGDGELYWALYQVKKGGQYESRWGVHDAAGTRLREAALEMAASDMRGVAHPLGKSTRAFFWSGHGLNVGAIFDATKDLVPQAYLMGSGDPHHVTASSSGNVVAVLTREATIYIWNLAAE